MLVIVLDVHLYGLMPSVSYRMDCASAWEDNQC